MPTCYLCMTTKPAHLFARKTNVCWDCRNARTLESWGIVCTPPPTHPDAIVAPIIVTATSTPPPVMPPAMPPQVRLVSPPVRHYGSELSVRARVADELETPMRRCECGKWYDSFWQFDLCPACDEEADT